MLKNAFVHAALTAAAMATFLASEAEATGIDPSGSKDKNQQTINVTEESPINKHNS